MIAYFYIYPLFPILSLTFIIMPQISTIIPAIQVNAPSVVPPVIAAPTSHVTNQAPRQPPPAPRHTRVRRVTNVGVFNPAFGNLAQGDVRPPVCRELFPEIFYMEE